MATKPAQTPAPRSAASLQERINALGVQISSENFLKQLQAALPKHIKPDRMARVVLTEVRKNSDLALCTPASFFGSMLTAAQLGLLPGVLGQCWLIPFNDNRTGTKVCTFIAGYRGLVLLAWNSGQIVEIDAHEVYEGDTFSYSFGLNRNLVHKPGTNRKYDPEKITHAWAVVKTKNGGTLLEVMDRAEIELHRKRSRSPDKGPWKTDYGAMACKTVLLQVLKLAPLSTDLVRAVQADETGMSDDLGAFDAEFSVAQDSANLDEVLASASSAEQVPTDEPKAIAAPAEGLEMPPGVRGVLEAAQEAENGREAATNSEPESERGHRLSVSTLPNGLVKPFLNQIEKFPPERRGIAKEELFSILAVELGPDPKAWNRDLQSTGARLIENFKP